MTLCHNPEERAHWWALRPLTQVEADAFHLLHQARLNAEANPTFEIVDIRQQWQEALDGGDLDATGMSMAQLYEKLRRSLGEEI